MGGAGNATKAGPPAVAPGPPAAGAGRQPGQPAAGAGPCTVSGPTTLRSVTDPGPDGILGVERSVLDRDSVHDLGGDSTAECYGPGAGVAMGSAGNRVGARVNLAPPTPPDVRVRIRRFASAPEGDGRDR